MAKKEVERKEALIRIVIGFIGGMILYVWGVLVFVLFVVNWVIVLFSGKRDRGIADFSEYWNSEFYRLLRYITFETNERPFPFSDMVRLGKFER